MKIKLVAVFGGNFQKACELAVDSCELAVDIGNRRAWKRAENEHQYWPVSNEREMWKSDFAEGWF